jgi:hypothetical protein
MTTAEQWLGKKLDTKTAPVEIVLRYLAAFGPASVADIRAWCGLAGVAEIVATLKTRLRRFRSEAGVELFDLKAAPRPQADIEAPARLLPGFDNLVLSHADRSRFLAEDHRSRIATNNGIFHPTLLVDGRIAGTWKMMKVKRETSIEMAPFARLGADQRRALRDEASVLLRAVGADGDHVRFISA